MGPLQSLLQQGFGQAENYNCTEKLVYGADLAYGLHLPPPAKRMMAGFGGGMGLGLTCGALSGAVAVISARLVEEKAHSTPGLKPSTQQYLTAFRQKMGSLDCVELRGQYRTKEHGCDAVVQAAAAVLDEMMEQLA